MSSIAFGTKISSVDGEIVAVTVKPSGSFSLFFIWNFAIDQFSGFFCTVSPGTLHDSPLMPYHRRGSFDSGKFDPAFSFEVGLCAATEALVEVIFRAPFS